MCKQNNNNYIIPSNITYRPFHKYCIATDMLMLQACATRATFLGAGTAQHLIVHQNTLAVERPLTASVGRHTAKKEKKFYPPTEKIQ